MKEFDPQTLAYLNDKFYVYALRDSGNGEVFYIGKGKGNRIFSHGMEAKTVHETDKQKLLRIHEIENRGDNVEHLLIHYGLSELEAFVAESTLINYIQHYFTNRTNKFSRRASHSTRHERRNI